MTKVARNSHPHIAYLEREDVADLRDSDHCDGTEEGDHAQDGRRHAAEVDVL